MPENFDYRSYEEFFRGSAQAISGREEELRDLLRFVQGKFSEKRVASWLDIGCGEGLFLKVLREEGIRCQGVEGDHHLAIACQNKGYDVLEGDAVVVAKELEQQTTRFDVISILHLVEHLNSTDCYSIIKSSEILLNEGGILLIVTPNIKDLRVAAGNFYRDPTHIKPYPRELIEFFYVHAGFSNVESLHFDRFVEGQDFSKITYSKRVTELLAESKKELRALKEAQELKRVDLCGVLSPFRRKIFYLIRPLIRVIEKVFKRIEDSFLNTSRKNQINCYGALLKVVDTLELLTGEVSLRLGGLEDGMNALVIGQKRSQ